MRTVGGGESIERNQHRLGPDLLNVTEVRDRAWLARWLKNPEEMLAEQDPIVMALYAEYDEVRMPNLRLTGVEVDALISYMESESRRVEETRAKEAHHDGDPHQH